MKLCFLQPCGGVTAGRGTWFTRTFWSLGVAATAHLEHLDAGVQGPPVLGLPQQLGGSEHRLHPHVLG